MSLGQLVHSVNTYRLRQSSGIQQTFQPNLVSQACLIQPISPEFAAKTGMAYGKTYNCFFAVGTDVVMTDKVVDQDNNEYRVAGSMNRNYGFSTQHLTVLLERQAGGGYQQ